MTEPRPTPTRSGPPREGDRSHLEDAYRRAVEAEGRATLLAVEVGGLERKAEACGVEPGALLGALEGALHALPGAERFVVAQRDGRLVALLPGATLERGEAFAAALVAACKELDVGGRAQRVLPVVGLAHLPDEEPLHLETLVRVAEAGARVAVFRGGGSVVHTMLYPTIERRVRREIEAEGARFAPPPARRAAAGASPAPATRARTSTATSAAQAPPAVPAEVERSTPVDPEPSGPDPTLVPQPAPSTTATAPPGGPDGPNEHDEPAEHDGSAEVQLLRRRVAKLVGALKEANARLAAVEAQRAEGPGLASMYRGVQGLHGDEPDYELKMALMREILAANRELLDAIAAGGGERQAI